MEAAGWVLTVLGVLVLFTGRLEIGLLMVVAGIVLRFVVGVRQANDEERTAECPVCKEQIVKGALKCKHCGSELVWGGRS